MQYSFSQKNITSFFPKLQLTIYISLLLLSWGKMDAQVVWENHKKEVYNYLSRMAQKGIIQYDDNIRPLSRKYIADCLDSLSIKTNELSPIEKKELSFYAKEYGFEMDSVPRLKEKDTHLFTTDPYKRWRSFSSVNSTVQLQVDPVIAAATFQGTGKNVNQTSSGLSFYGYVGKHLGFHFFYNDITEAGTGLDYTRQNNSETGFVRKDTSLQTSQNYSQLRGSISYSWKSGSFSFGQDHLLWGYGENGRIVLSDKPPTFPVIRFDIKLFPWLKFNYSHAWLNSALIDSAKTYPIGNPVFGGERQFFIAKFFSTHSIHLQVVKGLDLSIGESIIYSDREDVGYLFPLMFFKVYDNIANNSNIRTGSNGQLFLQVSSRNHIPKTHLYSTFFIDEIRMNGIFDKAKSRNQLGFTLGASVTDVVIPYLTLGLEYTRVNPFVYRNLIPAQNFTSHTYSLGDWMGNNFDRLIYSIKYTPFPRLKYLLRYQSIRKGGQGTLEEQYFQQPQPTFLFEHWKNQDDLFSQFSYEIINNLTLNASYHLVNEENRITLRKRTNNTFSVGFNFGL